MRKLLLFALIICFFASEADAQHRRRHSTFGKKKPPYRYEMIGQLGAANFLGDLGGANQIGTNGLKDLEYVLTRPAAGIGMRFKIQQFISFKGNFNWGIVRGDDKLTLEEFRHRRNINFRSPLVELSGQLEFNFIREQKGHIYKIKGVRGMQHKDRQIYLFAGGGGVFFNPKGKYMDGQWYSLHQFHTEGVNYSRVTGLLSIGGGFRVALNRYWGVGFELGMRKTFSDYIDDVSSSYADTTIFNGNPKALYFANPTDQTTSNYCYPCIGEQRGDHTDKDAYMFGMFTVGYKVMYRKRSRSKF
jgi:hypothetical protein